MANSLLFVVTETLLKRCGHIQPELLKVFLAFESWNVNRPALLFYRVPSIGLYLWTVFCPSRLVTKV